MILPQTMADTLGPVPPPPRTAFYPEREADLANALRQGVLALGHNADVRPLVEAAFRAGLGTDGNPSHDRRAARAARLSRPPRGGKSRPL
ncbi:hypothetical protein [Phyllobacterium bourgognense]|uniref:hypothetical protein n=1 Tax=Phyllobacterium bourgognense TaxID=314236 RepID=UPI0015F0CC70|nr:hypothetical protein [Phyllobacterium bourgognense]